MHEPSVADLARDLTADLRYCEQFPRCHDLWCVGWPAAIRRALAAEHDNRVLRLLFAELPRDLVSAAQKIGQLEAALRAVTLPAPAGDKP